METARAKVMEKWPEAKYKLYLWAVGNASTFIWQAPRIDLVEGAEDPDDQLLQKARAETPVIAGTSVEAMTARLQALQEFDLDEKKTYYGPPRGWLLHFVDALAEPVVWCLPLSYSITEFLCWALAGESILGKLSGGALDSLHRRLGGVFQIHLCGATLMWLLGATKRDRLQMWVKRTSGQVIFLTWWMIVAPASLILALCAGVGPAPLAQPVTAIYSAVCLDMLFFGCFFFFRAWRISRSSSKSVNLASLHEQAMSVGLLCTLISVSQRIFATMELTGHHVLSAVSSNLPESWWFCRFLMGCAEYAADVVFEPFRSRTYAAVFTGAWLTICIDGPRSALFQEGLKLRDSGALEFFGSKAPGNLERRLWRFRVPIYLVLRLAVTQGMTVETDPSF